MYIPLLDVLCVLFLFNGLTLCPRSRVTCFRSLPAAWGPRGVAVDLRVGPQQLGWLINQLEAAGQPQFLTFNVSLED